MTKKYAISSNCEDWAILNATTPAKKLSALVSVNIWEIFFGLVKLDNRSRQKTFSTLTSGLRK
jgi:hypothetical protein